MLTHIYIYFYLFYLFIYSFYVLLSYLLSYDCVAFYSLLETILAENAPTSIFQEENSPWLQLDEANTVFMVKNYYMILLIHNKFYIYIYI